MRMYDSAFKYANACLLLKSALMNFNGDADIVGSINGTAPPFRKYNKEVIFHSQPILGFSICRPNLGASVDTILYASYEDDDLRKTAFFAKGVTYFTFKGMYSQDIQHMFTGIATDELFLIRAECYARLNNKQAALDDLNYLLATRWKQGSFVPVSATTAAEALDKILEERRKELVMRQLRWMDIKRLNKEDRNIVLKRVIGNQVYLLPANDNRYALPLPTGLLQLTGMEQNLGW